ncbi:MAG: hypothetical protein WC521_04680 [Bdellovibrionales bacterium]|jgi:hypothetical protein
MDKYLALRHHLNNLRPDSWKASFSDIEDIIGAVLPPSARRFREWWGNDEQNGRHWLKVGWKTRNVDLRTETVTFFRFDADNFKYSTRNKTEINKGLM